MRKPRALSCIVKKAGKYHSRNVGNEAFERAKKSSV
jgi:hypothetical protein